MYSDVSSFIASLFTISVWQILSSATKKGSHDGSTSLVAIRS